MKKSFALLVLSALSLILFAGCGQDNKPIETEKPNETTVPVTTVPETTEPVTTAPPTKQDYIAELKDALEHSLNESDIFLEIRVKKTGLNLPIAIVRNGGGTESEIYGISLLNYNGREIYYTNGYVFTYVGEEFESKEPAEGDEDFFEQIKADVEEQYDEENIEISRTETEGTYVYTITVSGLDEITMPSLPETDEEDKSDLEGILGAVGEIEVPESLTFTLTTDKESILSLSLQMEIKTGEETIVLTVTGAFFYGEDADYPFYSEVKAQAAAGKV